MLEKENEINDGLKNVVNYSLTQSIRNNINKPSYEEMIMVNPSLRSKVIQTLTHAIQVYEEKEEYEICSDLLKFQNKIKEENGIT